MSLLDSVFGTSEEDKAVQRDINVSLKWRKYIEQCKDERPLWEAQVAVCENFAAGNHRVSVDKTGTFRDNPLLPGQIWRTVNLWPITLSVITTRLTANDPHWNPKKSQMEDVSDAEIEAADAALQHIWAGSGDSERSIKRELKKAIRSSYKQGRRLLYMRFDDELDLPVLDSFPLWDVYSDPSSNELRNKRWLCIVLPKHIDWLEEMYPNAKAMKLSPDHRLAESGMQEQFIKTKTGSTREQHNTVKTIYGFRIVRQDYEEDEWTEEEYDDEDGEEQVRTVKTGNKIKKTKTIILHEVVVEMGEGEVSPVLHREELEYESLTDIFDSLSPKEDEDFYARPPCIDWVDPSKSINSTYSTIEAYINMFGQGKWIMTRKGVQIPYGGLMGQKIYAQPGDLVQLPMHPLPSTHFTQLEKSIQQFQQITGVHGASMGNMPSGDTSGKALAQASSLDEQNSSDDVDNFKLCMERVAVKMLRLMADNWDEVRTIYKYDKQTGESKKLRVIGEKFGKIQGYDKNAADKQAEEGEELMAGEDPGEEDNVVMIRPFKRVEVEIVVGPFFKSVHKQEMLVQILNAGWQPGMNPVMDRVILDTIDIGVGREMVAELKKLRNPQLMIAEGKALLIAQGEDVPVTRTDPHEFLKGFYEKKAKAALESGDQRTASFFNAQAQKHAILIHKGMGGAGSSEVPTTLEEMMRGQGDQGLGQQGNAAPDLPPALDKAAESLDGGGPPIPGMD